MFASIYLYTTQKHTKALGIITDSVEFSIWVLYFSHFWFQNRISQSSFCINFKVIANPQKFTKWYQKLVPNWNFILLYTGKKSTKNNNKQRRLRNTTWALLVDISSQIKLRKKYTYVRVYKNKSISERESLIRFAMYLLFKVQWGLGRWCVHGNF